jgi:WD40 repeat protein
VILADPSLLRDLDEYWVHGRHPSGRLIAAEVRDVLENECAVWDLETGDVVWRPKAHSVVWSQDGATVALLVGEDGDDFELRSWPRRTLISRCVVRPWACCNRYVALSPRGDHAAVLWWHQTEGGVNLVALEDGAARHLEGDGYMTSKTNAVEGPAFSPDGRFVAISEGFTRWWLPEPGESPQDEPSPGGRLRRGRLTLIDVDSGSVHHRDVIGQVERGWIPPHDDWEHFELLGKPRFTSADEVVLSPSFGRPCRLTVPR